MTRWWRGLSNTVRFDLSARFTLYANLVLLPLFAGTAFAPQLGAATGVAVAAVAVHSAVCLAMLRAGLEHYLGRRERPIRLIAAAAAVTVAGVVGGYLAYPDQTPGHPDGPAGMILLVLGGTFVVTLSAFERLEISAAAGALACAALYGLSAAQGTPNGGAAVSFALILLAIGAAYRVTAWMLAVMWELDRSRHLQASLAVAEERLRFSRDLHDVVGRTLSVVALKSELAAQLAKRGRGEAVDEMLAVRQIAQDSLAELRSLVGGYRSAELAVELAGARSLLASAGVECRVIGDASRLPLAVQGVLGWVVREGTTNVLRHSEARTCVIAVRVGPAGDVTLTMDNDRVTGPAGQPAVRFGNGLTGVTERIAELGGTVAAERSGTDGFRLTVTVPTPADGAGAEPAGQEPAENQR